MPRQAEKTLSRLYLAARTAPLAAQSETAHRLVDELLAAAGYAGTAWEKDTNGRPTVSAEGLAVSMTHTRGRVFCALLADDDRPDARLGIDAEQVRPFPRAEKLAVRFFGPCEQAQVSAGPDPRAFFACFTAKEAFAKYCGDGLSHHLSGADTAAPDFEAVHGVRFERMERDGVLLTLCLPAGCFPTLHEI